MNKTEREYEVGFTRYAEIEMKCDRLRDEAPYFKSSVNAGEQLLIHVPMIGQGKCLVPGSLHLVFDIAVSGTKSWFMNNLSALLLDAFKITLEGKVVYNCVNENMYRLYEDLWLSKSDRENNMIEYGLCNENLRKLISGDDTGSTSSSNAPDGVVFSVWGKKQKINIDRIIKDHGLYSPFTNNNSFVYAINLPKAEDVLIAQSGSKIGTYKLENIKLEYETIHSDEISESIANSYGAEGRFLPYDHLELVDTNNWLAASTTETLTINQPRKSMKALVFLFTKTSGRKDSEEFLYPNIESVSISISGSSKQIFAETYQKHRFYDEAKRLFSHSDFDQNMTVRDFYKDKFALVFDLRTHQDKYVFGHGRRIANSQNGITLKFVKKSHTGELKCHIFILSDGLLNIMDNRLDNIDL